MRSIGLKVPVRISSAQLDVCQPQEFTKTWRNKSNPSKILVGWLGILVGWLAKNPGWLVKIRNSYTGANVNIYGSPASSSRDLVNEHLGDLFGAEVT